MVIQSRLVLNIVQQRHKDELVSGELVNSVADVGYMRLDEANEERHRSSTLLDINNSWEVDELYSFRYRRGS